mmetsp:Transcript_12956/g.18571  ORF Transcript_12956/g.18571 Transcript_12956/m.18571 type:complete len:406 (+) Transcript_12956:98-1315(+)
MHTPQERSTTQQVPVNDDFAHPPASMPLEFPRNGDVIQPAERLSQRLYFPSRGVSSVESNVLVSVAQVAVDDGSDNEDSRMESDETSIRRRSLPCRAYWIQRTLRDAIYGRVRLAVVLRRREIVNAEEAEWEVTSEKCAIKEMEWKRIRQGRGRLSENPIQEVRALQFLKMSNDNGIHPKHVVVPLDMFSDSMHLYLISPFCNGGELFGLLESKENQFSEREARFWMKQILSGLAELQHLRICHRDISLENIMIHNQTSLVIDFGMCLCVPFDNERNRLLMNPQGTCGKWHYMAPEIVANQEPFDGFAIDLWAAGVILFIMLLGYPPWEKAEDADERFRYMSRGYMTQLLTQWNSGLSSEVMDLLQKMLYKNPRQRLSLRQISTHPWFQKEDSTLGEISQQPWVA